MGVMFKLYERFVDFLRKELRVHSPTQDPWGPFKNNTAETCVCCGDVIPEGRQVCPNCEWRSKHPLYELTKMLFEDDNVFSNYKNRCGAFGVSVSFDMCEHDEYIIVTLSKNNYSVRSYISMYLTFEDIQDALNRLLDRFIERSKDYIVEAEINK